MLLPLGLQNRDAHHRVQEEGGKIIKAMQGKDGAYVYAAVQDPVGVYVALMPG